MPGAASPPGTFPLRRVPGMARSTGHPARQGQREPIPPTLIGRLGSITTIGSQRSALGPQRGGTVGNEAGNLDRSRDLMTISRHRRGHDRPWQALGLPSKLRRVPVLHPRSRSMHLAPQAHPRRSRRFALRPAGSFGRSWLRSPLILHLPTNPRHRRPSGHGGCRCPMPGERGAVWIDEAGEGFGSPRSPCSSWRQDSSRSSTGASAPWQGPEHDGRTRPERPGYA